MQLSGSDYIYISLFFISLMLSLAFWLSYKTVEPKKYTLVWSIVFALSAIKGVINAISPIFENRELYWVLINAFSLFLQWLTWAGFRLRAKRSPYSKAMFMSLILVELILIYYTVIYPHIGLRMMLIPYSGAVLMFLCGWEIYNKPSKTRAAEAATIIVFALYGISQFVAGTIAFMQGTYPQQELMELYIQTNLLFMPAAFTGLGLFTLLILVDDLGTRMKKLALTDQLTGTLNRRGFYAKAKQAESKASKTKRKISVIITDIDSFKSINDNHGHQAGDKALRVFAKMLEDTFSKNAIIGRIGGEEFSILLMDQPIANKSDNSFIEIENLRKNVEQTQISYQGMTFNITASFGLAEYSPEESSIENALLQADKALYQAKNNGRNNSVIFEN